MYRPATILSFIFCWCFESVSFAQFSREGELPLAGSVEIEDLTYSGTGCPAGSVSSYISDDAQALTLAFDDYIADSSVNGGRDVKNCKIDVKLATPPGWSYALFCVDYRGYADLDAGVTASHSASYGFGGRSKSLPPFEVSGPFADDYTRLTAIPIATAPYSRCQGSSLAIDTEIKVNSMAVKEKIVGCSSSRYRRTNCPFPKPIKKVIVARKHSSAPCRQGHSWGFDQNKIWVNYGCRAEFKVSYKDVSEDAAGLMTVDTIDGEITQHYGIAWRQCTANEEVVRQYSGLKSVIMDAKSQSLGRDGRPAKQIFPRRELVQGDLLTLTMAKGNSIGRVYHGTPHGVTPCPTNWDLYFKDGQGRVIEEGMPSALKDYRHGVSVPAEAATAWVGYRDTAYFDNEGMGGSRTPRSGSTGGCTFEFRLETSGELLPPPPTPTYPANQCRIQIKGICKNVRSYDNFNGLDNWGMQYRQAGRNKGACRTRATEYFNWCGGSASAMTTFTNTGETFTKSR